MGGNSSCSSDLSFSYNTNKEEEEIIALYSIISGRIKNDYINQLNKYEISAPYSEKILEYCYGKILEI